MQVCCPCCNVVFPIEAGFSDADGKRLATILADIDPTLGRALIGYLRLFKPPKSALRMSRAAVIAREVADLVAVGSVCRDERGGLRRPASTAVWAQGIEQMQQQRDRLTLPLDGHGYLRAVVFGIADQADASAERSREVSLRRGDTAHRAGQSSRAVATKLETAISYASSMVDLGEWSREQASEYVAKAQSAPG